jgi:hypothetical protein
LFLLIFDLYDISVDEILAPVKHSWKAAHRTLADDGSPNNLNGRYIVKIIISAAVSIALALSATQAMAQEKKQLAFVVNAASDFWKLAEAGVKKAQAELPNYELQFKYPAQGTAALQNALMDDLVAAGTDAIMISSVDPKTSIDAFNRIAGQVPLFTTDSDAPDSNRIAYLGSSNTLAGVQAGEVAVKALPGGASAWASSASSAPTTPRNASPASAGGRRQGHRAGRRARRRCRLRPGAQQCR